MLIEENLFGTVDKVKNSIERLKEYEPPEGYYVCFSGGKDSIVMYDLVKKSGVKFEVHYNLMTVEPPELLEFIKKFYPEVEMVKPPTTMFDLVVKHGIPPTRKFRYCTKELKITDVKNRVKVDGIRGEESYKRSKQEIFEWYKVSENFHLHCIHDWTEKDIWEYIHQNNLPYCKLYDEGFTRIGCVLCPFQNKKKNERDLERFPSIVQMYRDACNAAYANKISKGKSYRSFKSGEDVFNWWVNHILLRIPEKKIPDELSLFEGVDENGD